eukprot:GHVQ01014594.1.p1 GENE.GHVQ01014594.1~~GHVQ01014594.1.p1  ORF type:complete len:157 (+),score=11.22 GHVQ01014594.1:272-742(+)
MPDMREEPPISSYGELWSDVEVRDEYLDGVWPVAKISYTHDVRRCLLIFTALSRRKEVSDRMLNLTREVIQHSSANYTAWYFRRLCLLKLKKDLKQELDYVRLCAEESEKNYQVIIRFASHIAVILLSFLLIDYILDNHSTQLMCQFEIKHQFLSL